MNRFLKYFLLGTLFLGASAFPRSVFAEKDCVDTTDIGNVYCTCYDGAVPSVASGYSFDADSCNSKCWNNGSTSWIIEECVDPNATDSDLEMIDQEDVSDPTMVNTAASNGLSDAAADTKADFLVPILNVQIPGFEGFTTPTISADGGYVSVNFIAEYINGIYGWIIAAAALVAVVMMMIGGLQYTLSRGKSKYIEKAKTRITNAITGLVLLLASYSIAFLIDPNTTTLSSLDLANVEGIEADLKGQGGEEESIAITPNNFPIAVTPITGDHISYVGSSANKFADAEVVLALQTAATSFHTATGKNISVTDGTRSIINQATLFYNNCLKTGICSVPTCNPASASVAKKSGGKYVLVGTYASLTSPSAIIDVIVKSAVLSNCPHTSAVALDAWGGPRSGDFKNDIALQQILITAMIKAGFCRLSLEVWHFELEAKKVSTSSCSTSWSSTTYIRKDTRVQQTPDSDCKTWHFKNHFCAIRKP